MWRGYLRVAGDRGGPQIDTEGRQSSIASNPWLATARKHLIPSSPTREPLTEDGVGLNLEASAFQACDLPMSSPSLRPWPFT